MSCDDFSGYRFYQHMRHILIRWEWRQWKTAFLLQHTRTYINILAPNSTHMRVFVLFCVSLDCVFCPPNLHIKLSRKPNKWAKKSNAAEACTAPGPIVKLFKRKHSSLPSTDKAPPRSLYKIIHLNFETNWIWLNAFWKVTKLLLHPLMLLLLSVECLYKLET